MGTFGEYSRRAQEAAESLYGSWCCEDAGGSGAGGRRSARRQVESLARDFGKPEDEVWIDVRTLAKGMCRCS